MSKIEQTLSIIKPDAVERNLGENIKKIGGPKIEAITKQNNKLIFEI